MTTMTLKKPATPTEPASGKSAKDAGFVASLAGVLGRGVAHGFLVIWAAMILLPLGWALLSSLKTDEEIFGSPWALPSKLNWENFERAWNASNVGLFFFNTVIVVGGALLITMLGGAVVAYILARFEFKLNRPIFYLFITGMMFPIFLGLVPLFFIVQSMGLLGTKLGLILVLSAYGLPFTVFFMVGFFRTLPTAVAEAAMIDGCGHFGTFWRIMLPMARPGLISVGIFNFLSLWNNYLLPLVLNPDPKNYLLSQGLASLAVTQGYKADFSGLFAGLIIAMLPVLAIYLVFQSKIQNGLSMGALK